MARTGLANQVLGAFFTDFGFRVINTVDSAVYEIMAAWTEDSHAKVLGTDSNGKSKEVFLSNVRLFKTREQAEDFSEKLRKLIEARGEIQKRLEASEAGSDARKALVEEITKQDQAIYNF